jgi:hypothetical protein
VDHRVTGQRLRERRQLGLVGQVPVDQQVGDLDEGRLLGRLLDRDAAVAQDAALAVQEGDRALGGRRVHVRGVERHVPGLRAQLADIEAVFVFGSDDDGQVHHLVVDFQFGFRGRFFGHWAIPPEDWRQHNPMRASDGQL